MRMVGGCSFAPPEIMSELSRSPQTYPYDPQPAAIPPGVDGKPWPRREHPPTFLVELGILAVCVAFNALMPCLISAIRPEPVPFIALTMGALISQLAALCALLVFGEFAFWQRLLVVWSVGYGLAMSFVTGIYLADGPPNFGEVLRVMFCGLPLVALAVQLPLWGARLYCGWRIARPDAAPNQRPLSIGDILSGTAIAAVTVGLVRFVVDSPGSDSSFWIGWAIAVPAIAGISLISILPAMFLILRLNRPLIGGAVLFGYAVLASIVTILGLAYFNRRTPPPREVFLIFPLMIGALASSLGGLLGLIRYQGYRLMFAGDQWVDTDEVW